MANTLTAQQLIAYYQNLLIIQYNGLPKASATIGALANCSICDNFFTTLQNCFNLSTAQGDQLTIIGKIVGVPRMIYGLDLADTFFTLTNWSGAPASVGLNTWSNATPDTDKIASWQTTDIYTPTDFEMLALIQLKIMRNTYYPSMGILVPALWNLFGSGIQLVDNLNKTVTYNFSAPYHNVEAVAAFLGNICPKPMGCLATYNAV
jgi:uncharacterized protein DUF2612